MKTLSRFLTKFASLICSVLHCFDRVIFKGYLPISRTDQLEKFVDYYLGVRRNYFFKTLAGQYSDRLVKHAQAFAAQHRRTYLYRTGKFRKDRWALDLIREHGITEGLIGILCTIETCPSFKLVRGKGRPRFQPDRRPQRVLYYYFLDPQFGFMHIRIQTWIPFTVQIYVNGHDWLAQQMAKKNLAFVLRHNAFTQLANAAAAQKLASRFAKLNWPAILERYARRVNPLFRDVLKGHPSYYWVTEQAEFATDLLFTSASALSGLFAKLIQHAVEHFKANDIFTFLGRKLDRRFDGEVLTDYKTERWYGARIKHGMQSNWVKMYNKFGLILRIETVINDPTQFKIYRVCHHRDDSSSMGMYAMPKGVAYLPHYQEQALACNLRYLDAMAVVDDPAPAHRSLVELIEPKHVQGRSYAGFNPASAKDLRLFRAVLDGKHVAQGFRNKDIRAVCCAVADNKEERHRQSAAIGRLFKRLHVRQLIAKIPRSRRWRVTELGRRLLGKAVELYTRDWPELLAQAA